MTIARKIRERRAMRRANGVVEQLEQLRQENARLASRSEYLERAVSEVQSVVYGVRVPNGTTRRIKRIVDDAMIEVL